MASRDRGERERDRERVAQAKSRAERARPPVQPTPHVEIVPGRLSETDWLSLLAAEEAEEVVGDVVAELLGRVLDLGRKGDLARQLVPYVINQAREAILQITEWRFMAPDEGETNVATEPTWQEDEEPVPFILDSSALDSGPALRAMPTLKKKVVRPANLRATVTIPQVVICDVDAAPPRVEELSWPPSREKVQPVKQLLLPRMESLSPILASASSKTKRAGPAFRSPLFKTWMPSREELLNECEKQLLLGELSHVPEEKSRSTQQSLLLPPSCSNLLRIQVGRPPTIKDVLYDSSGNITAVPRLDPARLPKGWVKPSVEVVDPDVESQRQEALKTVSGRCKQRYRAKPPWLGADTVDRGLSQPSGVHQAVQWAWPGRDAAKKPSEQVAPPPAPGRVLKPICPIFVKPNLLMETIRLAPGVTIRDADGIRWGTCPSASQEESERMHGELKPMPQQIPFTPSVAVEKVTREPQTLALKAKPRFRKELQS